VGTDAKIVETIESEPPALRLARRLDASAEFSVVVSTMVVAGGKTVMDTAVAVDGGVDNGMVEVRVTVSVTMTIPSEELAAAEAMAETEIGENDGIAGIVLVEQGGVIVLLLVLFEAKPPTTPVALMRDIAMVSVVQDKIVPFRLISGNA